jgi:hypothetical protein
VFKDKKVSELSALFCVALLFFVVVSICHIFMSE